MKRVFIDTNVFIDFIARRAGFYENAALIVSLAYRKKIWLQISALSFATASYILENHYKMKKDAILDDYIRFIELCGITTVDHETVKASVEAPFDDFEDAMQYISAREAGANFIVTRNKADFTGSVIPVMEPQEFLKRIVNQ